MTYNYDYINPDVIDPNRNLKFTDGSKTIPFIYYEVVANKRFVISIDVFGKEQETVELNDKIYLQVMPSGDIYLHQYKGDAAFMTGAMFGRDFRWS